MLGECLVVCVMITKGGVGGLFGCMCDDDLGDCLFVFVMTIW